MGAERKTPPGCHRLPDGHKAPSPGGKIPWELPGCGHEVRRKQPACDTPLPARKIGVLGALTPPFSLPAPHLGRQQLPAPVLSWVFLPPSPQSW